MPIDHFLDYLSLEKKYSSHTVTAYRADLESFSEFLTAEYGQEELQEVNYAQVRSWIIELAEEGLTNRTINRKISSLKAFYRFLQKTGQITVSPLLKHRALKTSKKVQIPFSRAEVNEVLEKVNDTSFEGLRDKFMLELFYSTGIRRIELIELSLDNLDLAEGIIKVKGKRNKERLIPLLSSVRGTAEAYLQVRNEVVNEVSGRNLFLTSGGVKMNETLVYRLINNYFRSVSSKVKKSPHILRHSFATHLLDQGANLNAVKELLGHSSLAATQVYTHNSIAELTKVHKNAHPRSRKK